jgi:DNA-binding MarR family transcriptional regulator
MFLLQDQSVTRVSPRQLDFELPDDLLYAREAALLPLRPALKARERNLNEYQAQFLRLLSEADEPMAVSEMRRRSGICKKESYDLAHHLVAQGYAGWTEASPARNNQMQRKLFARDIGRRQINHIGRDAARNGAGDWPALAALPNGAHFDDAMRQRLFALLTRLTRASRRDAALDGANEAGAGDDRVFGLTLRLRLARTALIQRLKPSLKKYGFTEPQWRILRIIASQPGLGWSVGALVARGCFHFASPDVHRALFYLSQRGLVQKYGEGERPKDWRLKYGTAQKRWNAEISRNGRDIIGMVETHLKTECADLFARLDADEMTELSRLLARVTRALLWRDGVDPDVQDTHPFAAEYLRFKMEVQRTARAWAFEHKIRREAGVPVRKRRITHWWV